MDSVSSGALRRRIRDAWKSIRWTSPHASSRAITSSPQPSCTTDMAMEPIRSASPDSSALSPLNAQTDPLSQSPVIKSGSVASQRAGLPASTNAGTSARSRKNFDARLYPYGWDNQGFVADEGWIPPMLLPCPSSLPPICSRYPDDLMETAADRRVCCLLPRSIPLLQEYTVAVSRLCEASSIIWKRPPEEYFAMAPADAYTQTPFSGTQASPDGVWHFRLGHTHGIALTFEFAEQIVGFPEFTIDAPEGTVVELLVHEAHAHGRTGPSQYAFPRVGKIHLPSRCESFPVSRL